jgi:LysR family transcriptional regulator, carnitine catabolism transcriptional activator
LPSVEGILGDTEALVGHTKDISAGIAGRGVMAALPSISATVLPQAIAQFRSEHPRISVVLRDALAEKMVDMVRNDEVDFAISSKKALLHLAPGRRKIRRVVANSSAT